LSVYISYLQFNTVCDGTSIFLSFDEVSFC